ASLLIYSRTARSSPSMKTARKSRSLPLTPPSVELRRKFSAAPQPRTWKRRPSKKIRPEKNTTTHARGRGIFQDADTGRNKTWTTKKKSARVAADAAQIRKPTATRHKKNCKLMSTNRKPTRKILKRARP